MVQIFPIQMIYDEHVSVAAAAAAGGPVVVMCRLTVASFIHHFLESGQCIESTVFPRNS